MATKPEPWDEVYDQINVHRASDWIPILPPTDSELDHIEAQLGSPLPRSYRAFLKQFGSGDLAGTLRLTPIALPNIALVEATADQRELLANDKELNAEWLGGVVYFGCNNGGEHYVWDPEELTVSETRECPVYWLPRHEEEYPRLLAKSFFEFIGVVLVRAREWLQEEPDAEEIIENEFEPHYLRMKEQSNRAEVALWLAFNNHTVRDLAISIRDRGQTDAFPILADALQEAGCTNADLLDSCRTGDPDIDGAWVLQVLLGKA